MKTHALPKPIKSKNPIVILKAVICAIEEEPKRYDQYNLIERRDLSNRQVEYFPSCGTVACLAGWTHLLTGGRSFGPALSRAQKILKLTDNEAATLFDSTPLRVRPRRDVSPDQHASDGIKHIKRFVLKKWGKKI